jgi:integrase
MSDGTPAADNEAAASSKRVTRAELIKLQQTVAQKQAPKPPIDTKFWHPDTSLHLHLRLYPSGRGAWFTNYDTPRRRGRSWKIGDAAVINTTSAENQAKKIQARVQLGEDPQEERKELRDRPRLTVRALCRQFFDEVHKDPNFSPKTEKGYRNIEKNHLGALGDLMFEELCSRQNEIVTHVRKLSAEVSAGCASALRTMLGSTYKWAMTVYPDNIPRNPVTGTWLPDYKVQKHGQALTMEQLGAVWRACEAMERDAVPTYRGNALGATLTGRVEPSAPFVSAREAAKILGMGRKDLLNKVHDGRLDIKVIVRTPKKATHYTAPLGERGGRKLKMTPQQRQEAAQRLADGERQADVARAYGVDQGTIRNLARELLPTRDFKNRPHYLFAAEDLKRLTEHRFNAMRSVDLEYSVLVRLMILFGSRYGEMGRLAWSEIDLEKGVLHIPTLNPDGSRRLKSNRGALRDLTIYMPQPAIDLIKKIPRRPGRDFLFGIGPNGLTENDIQKKTLDAIILKNEGAPIVHRSIGSDGKEREDYWTLHWLRHSFSTRLDEEMGVDLRIIRAITNHLSRKQKDRMWGGENEPGQHKRYTHSKYPAQQLQALTAWAQAVLDAAHRVERKGDEKVVWNAFGKTAS